jgi:hypothetical protein
MPKGEATVPVQQDFSEQAAPFRAELMRIALT